MTHGLAHCVGGPCDGQTVPGVAQWAVWRPHDIPSTNPPRNLSHSEIASRSHYSSVGVVDGVITYVWKEVG